MPRIILIETSTALCTTALISGNETVCRKESAEPRSQASMTAPFIKQMLDEAGITVADCDAVCVSSGPGSYTGLRVGVSTAKGLCFAANIPLISVDTMEILVRQAIETGIMPQGCRHVVPMIDARRMEVYTATYIPEGEDWRRCGDIRPMIVDADSFRDILEDGPVLFIGDGAAKCADIISSPDAYFVQTNPVAWAMRKPAIDAFNEKRFENTAYFEPFYLKQFVATVSGRKLF